MNLDAQVLVLNRAWVPIDLTTVFEAVCKVFSDRAKFVDPETYQTYAFEDWIENWSDAVDCAKVDASRIIGCPGLSIVAPEIFACTEYDGIGIGKMGTRCRPKFSRRNVMSRDRGCCQYCGKKFPLEELNFDHVVPRSQGGRTSWTNIVLSCVSCNSKKGGRTPKQAGMRLIRRPVEPVANELRGSFGGRLRRKLVNTKVPKSWEALLGKMYWNVGMKD